MMLFVSIAIAVLSCVSLSWEWKIAPVADAKQGACVSWATPLLLFMTHSTMLKQLQQPCGQRRCGHVPALALIC